MKNFLLRHSLARLRNMVEAIHSRDFTLHYSLDNLSGEERKLAEEINAVVSDFRSELIRQESQYGCYETMLNQVNAALIVADTQGKVTWMNDTAIKQLCGFRIHELSMLKVLHPELPDELESLEPGQQKLIKMRIDDHEVEWKVSMARYTRGGNTSRLFSIENIQYVIQQSETDAQNKLVSVLTHEIMNSLTPIISLSDTLCDAYKNGEISDDEAEQALQAINRRSQGLLNFVENYRKLSRISHPKPEWVKIGDIIKDMRSLLPSPSVHFNIEDEEIQLYLDRHQFEQVIINLLKNGIEACSEKPLPEVVLKTRADHANRHFLITVTDNGDGISPEAMDRIFVPFFTTKPNGSGIGLSLSKKIVNMHNGIIKVKSSAQGTVFTIQLPLGYKR